MTNGWVDQYQGGFGRLTPVVKWLLIVTIGVFLLQDMTDRALDGAPFTRWFALSLDGVLSGRLWQPVTYMFLHGPWFHLFLNMFLLFMLGPETERRMGGNQFLILYFLSGILGGLGWLILSAASHPNSFCVGASGAIFGVIGAFAALFPHRDLNILLFFVIPVRMKAWVLAAGLGAIELWFLIADRQGTVANAAHLAGGLAGFVYARQMFQRGSPGGVALRFPTFHRPPRPDRSAEDAREIDRILDKMHRAGVSSLTPAERKALERHSRRLRGK